MTVYGVNIRRYYVTDPCYLMNNDEVWEEFLKYYNDSTYDKAMEILKNEIHTDFLEVCDTGFGDWQNTIYGDGVINSNFCADSGLVCVARVTKELEDFVKKTYTRPENLIASFDTDTDIEVKFDTENPNWTVVDIKDEHGNMWRSSYDSENDEDDWYDEDEDYWDDEDEDDEDYDESDDNKDR